MSANPLTAAEYLGMVRHAAVRALETGAAPDAIAEAAAVRGAPTEGARALLLRGSSIKPEPVTWLWDGWLPLGKLTLLAGSPGTGKTTLALRLAATITSAGMWPDGTQAARGAVVLWSGEDDAADVLVPRLIAAGADLSRVHIVTGITGQEGRQPFDPARDMELLQRAMGQDVRLLILDPLVSAVTGDSHKNAEVRRGLQPVVDLAAHQRCAVLGISHLSKGTAGRDPVERVTGSMAFGALARVVLLAAREQPEGDKPARRLLLRAKSNVGRDDGGFEYSLQQMQLAGHPDIASSVAHFGAAVDGTARELMAAAEEVADAPGTDAADFLRDLLADGPCAAKTVFAEAAGAGFSRDQMKRAKARIGAVAAKQGMAGGWLWQMQCAEGSAEGSEEGAQKRLRPSRSSSLPSGEGDIL